MAGPPCRRGLYKSLFLKIMSIHDRPELKLLSPVYVAAHSLLQQQRAAETADEAAGAGSSGSGAGEGAEDEEGEEEDCGEGLGLLAAGRASSGELSEAEGGMHRVGADVAMAAKCAEERCHRSGASAAQQQHLAHAESAMAVHAGCEEQAQRAAGHDSASSLIAAYWGGEEDGSDCEREPPSCTAAAVAVAAEVEGVVGREDASVPTAGRPKSSAELVPLMVLLHGDADRCAPVEGAEQVSTADKRGGC